MYSKTNVLYVSCWRYRFAEYEQTNRTNVWETSSFWLNIPFECVQHNLLHKSLKSRNKMLYRLRWFGNYGEFASSLSQVKPYIVIYIYIDMCIYICTQVYIYTYIYICVHAHVYVCARVPYSLCGPFASIFKKVFLCFSPLAKSTGTLPTQLGKWAQVQQVYLSGNSIAGIIPSECGRWAD